MRERDLGVPQLGFACAVLWAVLRPVNVGRRFPAFTMGGVLPDGARKFQINAAETHKYQAHKVKLRTSLEGHTSLPL